MEEILKQITWYHGLSIASLAGFILCLILLVIIYKKLGMRNVLDYFHRKRKKNFLFMTLITCGVLYCIMSMRVCAAELPEDLPATLEEFMISSGGMEKEYISDTVQINITIRDKQENFDGNFVRLEYQIEGQEEWKQILHEEQVWENPEDGMFQTEYLFEAGEAAEAAYTFRVGYTDATGNEISETKTIVIDKIAPVFEAIYADEEGRILLTEENDIKISPYYNSAKEVMLDLYVAERYLDEEKTNIKIICSDLKGTVIKQEILQLEEGQVQTAINTDGHYKVEAHMFDKAGNETVHKKAFALDYTPPGDPVITYALENGNLLSRILHQLTFGYFAKEKVTAQILVEDIVSGVKRITCTYEDMDTKDVVTEKFETENGKIELKLPFSFKGNLKVYSEDFMGNISEEYRDIGVIAETQDTHKQTSKAGVKVLTKYSKTPNYYAGDVKVQFSVQDTYSGIGSISYLAGTEHQETDRYTEETEIVTNKIIKEYEISASENQQNNVKTGLSFKDNAGHENALSEEELPVIHIDTVSPQIRVVYDNYDAKNEKYYLESRTAAIYVTERNFDPDDVEFEISGPDTEISSWTQSDTDMWQCQVKFTKDGDYRFGFSCTDLAGNTGSYGKYDEFIIDQTKPVSHVSYDNHDVRNGIYYNKPRIATVTITEKNFRSEDAEVHLSAEHEGKAVRLPDVSGWSSAGERHQTVITYDYDAIFTFGMGYTDLAGNQAEVYVENPFCVDLTSPQIIISEVSDKSANAGEVSPLITITDTNYMEGSQWFELIGWQNGLMDAASANVRIPNGVMIRLQNPAHTKEMDDLYQLRAGTIDLAGNQAEVQIRFSVNRFGSVYTMDQVTDYYTIKEKQLVITETNVDTLVFKEIICSLNGNLKTLRPGIDYTVVESGDDTSWKQYRYTIYADNFKEEGHYNVTIYSKDRAKNLSDNQSQGKRISFAVDKSAPSIVISGIEQNGRYRANSQEIMVDVQDNLALEKMTVIINDKTENYDMKTLNALSGKIKVTAVSQNDWQTLQVSAKDRAGNEIISEKITFLVTPNLLVQFYHQKPLFYGSLTGVFVIVVGVSLIYMRKRKSS